MLNADYIIDIGPRAGRKGGEVVFQGTPQEMLKANTLTAQSLHPSTINPQPSTLNPQPSTLHPQPSSLTLLGARGNNLKGVNVSFPLGKLILVTGVSGSGKSTLINETLQPILSQHFFHSLKRPLPYDSIEGIENIDKVVNVDQS